MISEIAPHDTSNDSDAVGQFTDAKVLSPPDETFTYYRPIDLTEYDVEIDTYGPAEHGSYDESDFGDEIADLWNGRMILEKLVGVGLLRQEAKLMVGDIAEGPLSATQQAEIDVYAARAVGQDVQSPVNNPASAVDERRQRAETTADDYRSLLVTQATYQNRIADAERYTKASSRDIRRAYSRYASIPLKYL